MSLPSADLTVEPFGNLGLRLFALATALLYLPCALTWSNGIAGIAAVLPWLSWRTLLWAERRDLRAGIVPSERKRQFHLATLGLILGGAAAAVTSLILTLTGN